MKIAIVKSASDKMNNIANEKLENVFDLEKWLHTWQYVIFFTLTTAPILKVSDIIIIQL